jgi:uncharacterized membrane protein YkvA (DUF1232 family)
LIIHPWEKERMNEKKIIPTWLIYPLSAVGIVYLLNPTSGIIELIPDNLPLVGNLDEAAAALLVWQGISQIISTRKK